jgi:hypothetical protein
MSIDEATKFRESKLKRACWYCRKIAMGKCPELGAEWYKCSNCGATNIAIPKLLSPVLAGTWKDFAGIEHQSPRQVSKGKKAKE